MDQIIQDRKYKFTMHDFDPYSDFKYSPNQITRDQSLENLKKIAPSTLHRVSSHKSISNTYLDRPKRERHQRQRTVQSGRQQIDVNSIYYGTNLSVVEPARQVYTE